MNSNAKFGVGASVYLVCEKNGKYFVEDRLFEVARISKDDDGFHYSLKSDSDHSIDWCYEYNLFVTRKQADAEALVRNLKG